MSSLCREILRTHSLFYKGHIKLEVSRIISCVFFTQFLNFAYFLTASLKYQEVEAMGDLQLKEVLRSHGAMVIQAQELVAPSGPSLQTR